ncbi:hypothetical protein [Dokdonella immobilis]|uniref:hypothetical protein n=1 Tax=Dokdonella immobilis TaxID=578942 RepID=UPI00111438DD|nr:hypothetical protein [Dokdonella immobilis]
MHPDNDAGTTKGRAAGRTPPHPGFQSRVSATGEKKRYYIRGKPKALGVFLKSRQPGADKGTVMANFSGADEAELHANTHAIKSIRSDLAVVAAAVLALLQQTPDPDPKLIASLKKIAQP